MKGLREWTQCKCTVTHSFSFPFVLLTASHPCHSGAHADARHVIHFPPPFCLHTISNIPTQTPRLITLQHTTSRKTLREKETKEREEKKKKTSVYHTLLPRMSLAFTAWPRRAGEGPRRPRRCRLGALADRQCHSAQGNGTARTCVCGRVFTRTLPSCARLCRTAYRGFSAPVSASFRCQVRTEKGKSSPALGSLWERWDRPARGGGRFGRSIRVQFET